MDINGCAIMLHTILWTLQVPGINYLTTGLRLPLVVDNRRLPSDNLKALQATFYESHRANEFLR